MFKKIKQYFQITRIEGRSILAILSLILAVHILSYYIASQIKPSKWPFEFDSIPNHIASLEHLPTVPPAVLFNPNTASYEQWKSIGLAESKIQVILRYKAAGGQFHQIEDLKKIYVLSDADYTSISQHLYIEPPKGKPAIATKTPKFPVDPPVKQIDKSPALSKQPLTLIELNTASVDTLLSLPGIGWTLANRIIKYRNILGGYISISQLQEVYGLSEQVIEHVSDYLAIDTSQISKLQLNQVQVPDLLRHPYFSSHQAQAIVNYRNQHGQFQQLEDLLKIHTINEEFLSKIVPYLAL